MSKRRKMHCVLSGILTAVIMMTSTMNMGFHVYAQETLETAATEHSSEEQKTEESLSSEGQDEEIIISQEDTLEEVLTEEQVSDEISQEAMTQEDETWKDAPRVSSSEEETFVQPDMIKKALYQNVNGITITVAGNMPKEAELSVTAQELSQEVQKKLMQTSDIMQATEEQETFHHTLYSYDISICYQNKEYEPYLFDESMEVTFSFANEQELKDIEQMELFHVDSDEKIEKIEIKETTAKAVCFDADEFSTYILITKIEYTGEKSWSYEFTGDVQTFTAPVSGEYVFECYGAGTDKSKGSFAKGTIGLKKDETVSVYVGGQRNTFNGGGTGGSVYHSASNSEGSFSGNVTSDDGCGATDVRMGTELENRLIVAGGGGGNGHEGGVNYSYNGFDVSGGRFYHDVWAFNTISSNASLGQGSSYQTYVNSGDWGSGSYPDHGTYSYRVVRGGGGGGYFGGESGYAGTSKIIPTMEYEEKEYHVTDSIIENLVSEGNGKCRISLYSLEADVITYYNYNMVNLGEAAGLTGSHVKFPQMAAVPARSSDSQYDYTYLGWDDMATERIEHYTDAETVASALHGDRNYIAAYESVGKSYTVTLDSEDAQEPGTTNVSATYHSTLPDLIIPEKKDVIFAGYYTEQNGAGRQIYSAAGKGLMLSEFDRNSILYAHWIQPIADVKNPEDKEVIAGYSGILLTTEAQLKEQAGYMLSYQWYQNTENDNTSGTRIEAADSRRLVIPMGLPVGKYYFYCVITAEHVLNGQKVSIITKPSCFLVEKGSISMDDIIIENERCIYDGTPKTLAAAISNSNPYTIYYGTEPLNKENYTSKGAAEPNNYTEAGNYVNYIYVTGTDFVDFAGSIAMILEKAEPRVYLSSKNTAYSGKIQSIDKAIVYGTDDKKIEADVTYEYYMDESCTRKTNSGCGAKEEGGEPIAVGTYYVHARTKEAANYKTAKTKIPAMFNILGTNVKYSISGFHGIYDRKPHGLYIVNESKEIAAIYFSDTEELTENNYKSIGTMIPYEYTKVGKYPIYYLVAANITGGITQYESGVSEVIIEPPKQNSETDNSENHYHSDDSSNSDSSKKEFNFPKITEIQREISMETEDAFEKRQSTIEYLTKSRTVEAGQKEQSKPEKTVQETALTERTEKPENLHPLEKSYHQEKVKESGNVWRFLLPFLLGAAVMLLICQLVRIVKENYGTSETGTTDGEDC